jgi:hypothetical protein
MGLAATVLAAAAAAADVTVSRVTTMDGFGGGMTTETSDRIKGTNRRSDLNTKFGNALMNKMAGGARTEIVLVSEDKMLSLNPAKKTYRQGTISEMGKALEKARPQSGAKKESKSSYRVTKSSVKVEPTGEKKAIAGFPCERVRMTMVLEVENVETKAKSEMRLVTDNWNTPETGALKALREAEAAYGKAFAQKMGLDLSGPDADRWGLGMAAMMGLSQDQMKANVGEMKKELAKMKGVAVVTEIAWYNKQEGAAKPKQAAPSASSAEDKGGMPSLSGGAGGFAAGLAGRMMAKKMEASAAKSRAGSEARASGEAPVFKSRTEIKSVSAGAVDSGMFQVPAGYKLEK